MKAADGVKTPTTELERNQVSLVVMSIIKFKC